MNIILVSIHVEKTPPAFPLAAAVLKTAFENDKSTSTDNVILENFYPDHAPGYITAKIAGHKAEACGFSVYTWNAAEIIKICTELRNLVPGMILFAGGPQATAAPSALVNTGVFDFIIRGEGESVIADALKLMSSQKPTTTKIIDAEPADFAASPSPYPSILGKQCDSDGVLWEISRGCPYNCAFCYESGGCKDIRSIPLKRINEELEIFRKNDVKKIWVLDPTFNHNRTHAETVLGTIREIYPEAHYTFEIRAELMTRKLCAMFSGINASLQIGLQTTNPKALKNINRSLDKQKFLDNCLMMSEYGLTFGIDLIYGLPGDNYKTFCASLDFAIKAAPNNIDIFPLSVLPGTKIAEKVSVHGIRHKGFPGYEIIESETFSPVDMKRAAGLTESADILYNREQAFAWFNTITDATGCSASELFERFGRCRDTDPLDFIKMELGKRKKDETIPIMESFIRWSRAAESAFANPGKAFDVKLCRAPEILDKLATVSVGSFMRNYPKGKERNYRIFFDGEELFIT